MSKQEKQVKPTGRQDKVNGYAREGGLGQIKIVDNVPGAEYANAMQVNHTKDEIQIMFLNLFGASGKVTGKFITSPGHAKRMVVALSDAIKKYEDKFGMIKEAETNDKEIGFKG
jgi:uncharacterized protein with ACT and thioredoxin-like domain